MQLNIVFSKKLPLPDMDAKFSGDVICYEIENYISSPVGCEIDALTALTAEYRFRIRKNDKMMKELFTSEDGLSRAQQYALLTEYLTARSAEELLDWLALRDKRVIVPGKDGNPSEPIPATRRQHPVGSIFS